MEPYDASTPAPSRRAPRDPLLRMQVVDANQRLLAFLDEMDEMVAAGRARDREQGLDPSIATLLDAISGADDAPLEFRSIHRRVAEGRLTWEDFWDAPEEEAGGHRLVNVAMKAAGASLNELLREHDEDEPPS